MPDECVGVSVFFKQRLRACVCVCVCERELETKRVCVGMNDEVIAWVGEIERFFKEIVWKDKKRENYSVCVCVCVRGVGLSMKIFVC